MLLESLLARVSIAVVSIPWWLLGTALAACSLAYAVGLVVYRLYFHPLSRFPGPRLAAATYWYEVYYVIVRGGKYVFKYPQFREDYGPIVRINPDELLITDPASYDAIYGVGSKFSKDPNFYRSPNIGHALFAVTSNSEHRKRRAPFDPFYSRGNVLKLEHAIQNMVDVLLARVRRAADAGTPVDLTLALRALANDVITNFALGQPVGLLERDDFGESFHFTSFVVQYHFSTRAIFPFLGRLEKLLPRWLEAKIMPTDDVFTSWLEQCRKQLLGFQKAAEEGRIDSKQRPTLFQDLVKPGAPLGTTYTMDQLVEEAVGDTAAGGETAGTTMCVIVFQVLDNPDIHRRVVDELCAAFPDRDAPMKYTQLEALPYFSAVINEGLRYTTALSERLPESFPRAECTAEASSSPREYTRVGMSAWSVHLDETLFPNPRTFNPDRWLGPDRKKLENNIVSFSKGSRACIGMHVARCEMHLGLAQMLRRFELRLFETTEEDMRFDHVYMTFFHGKQRRHLKVMARPRAE